MEGHDADMTAGTEFDSQERGAEPAADSGAVQDVPAGQELGGTGQDHASQESAGQGHDTVQEERPAGQELGGEPAAQDSGELGAEQELRVSGEGEQEAKDDEPLSHLFAIRTTGGQEKVVMRLLEAKANANKINIQSVMLVDNLKGYVVVEAVNPSDAYMALEGIRHIRGQLRGELSFKDIEGYLVKKSTISQLAVDNVIEITGGPFKGMKATITRIDPEKEEATVVLLDASYQLPVTVDANYLKLAAEA